MATKGSSKTTRFSLFSLLFLPHPHNPNKKKKRERQSTKLVLLVQLAYWKSTLKMLLNRFSLFEIRNIFPFYSGWATTLEEPIHISKDHRTVSILNIIIENCVSYQQLVITMKVRSFRPHSHRHASDMHTPGENKGNKTWLTI